MARDPATQRQIDFELREYGHSVTAWACPDPDDSEADKARARDITAGPLGNRAPIKDDLSEFQEKAGIYEPRSDVSQAEFAARSQEWTRWHSQVGGEIDLVTATPQGVMEQIATEFSQRHPDLVEGRGWGQIREAAQHTATLVDGGNPFKNRRDWYQKISRRVESMEPPQDTEDAANNTNNHRTAGIA